MTSPGGAAAADDRVGRGEQEGPHLVLAGQLEQPGGGVHVEPVGTDRVLHRSQHRGDGGQVDDHIGPRADGPRGHVGVAQVADDRTHRRVGEGPQVGHGNLVPLGQQSADHSAADEPGAAGHQDAGTIRHACSVQRLEISVTCRYMPSRQALGTMYPPVADGLIRHPVLPVSVRSRYPDQLRVTCRMAGNVRPRRTAGQCTRRVRRYCPAPRPARMPCCAEVATRRNAGANPGLSRNCDRG